MMVLQNVVPGFDKCTVLDAFATSEECRIERDRIGFAMAEAYPHERDFAIACQLRPKYGA